VPRAEFNNRFFHGGNVVRGIGRQKYYDELKTLAVSSGSILILHRRYWPWPPCCFCVTLHVAGRVGFTIRTFGAFRTTSVWCAASTARQFTKCAAAGAGDQELLGLRIAEEAAH